MDIITFFLLLLVGGLIAWALKMMWDIHRGRQKGCESCKLYETSLAHPPNSPVCKTCGGFNVDLRNNPRRREA